MGENRETEQVARSLFLCMGLLRRRLRQRPVADVLTFPQMAALSRLDRCGPATSADLARQEQISPQSMGTTIGELEARGFITRQPDPTDGRRILLSISASGSREVNRRRDARVEQLAAGLADFTAHELAQLSAAAPLIERLAQRL
ncbi:MarR family transcriptional regulator [Mycolicibacterium fluoranthenivorans]|jgi:DNA-binding MarR family transcriptional regulator|uniref:MarR family transcriptional regulator n=1 Tax=Mycolicibacterium fluoranthenivorans TaxID=258505 RepID=A0A7G8PGN0_9MYCO|nr:MarR family transcriptional regulator [Mycolicibacterium fluoranthenivorans]QNJ93496.1 MarR family transcriptional regulator [Mycolicibacterium fluoranthenivorans]